MSPALDLCLNLVVFLILLVVAVFLFTTEPKATGKEVKEDRRKQDPVPLHSHSRETPLTEAAAAGEAAPTLLSRPRPHRLVGTVQRYSERNGIGFIANAQCRVVETQRP
eukprot:Skav218045  [mRNA]  locus=scaffold214:835459:843689:- [translate_table: standard]